jgi:hypothetical protein
MKSQTLKKEPGRILSDRAGGDQSRGGRYGLKDPDEVSEVAHELRQDESGKSTVRLSKALLIGGGRTRAFEFIMIDRSAFCG